MSPEKPPPQPVDRGGNRRGCWRRRSGAVAALVSLLTAVIVVVTPTAASAGNIVACPTDWQDAKLVRDRKGDLPFGFAFEYYRYTVLSATPLFAVSDGRFLQNGLDTPVEHTISSSVSTTVKVVVSVGFETGVVETFKTTVNASIEASRTTAIAVSTTVTVPPHTTLIAEYGVHSYQIQFGASLWRSRRGGVCEEWGWYPQSTMAPTVLEGWRLRTG